MHFPKFSVRFSLMSMIFMPAACLLAPFGAFAESPILGPEFQINLTTQGAQTEPEISSNGIDRVLVTWTSQTTADPLDATISAREIIIGSPEILPEMTVADTADLQLLRPSVAYGHDGSRALITWVQTDGDAQRAIMARVLTSPGVLGTMALRLESSSGLGWFSSRVVPRPDGEFVVGWTDGEIPNNGLVARTVTVEPFGVIGDTLLGVRGRTDNAAFYVSQSGLATGMITRYEIYMFGPPWIGTWIQKFLGLWPVSYDESEQLFPGRFDSYYSNPVMGPVGNAGEMVLAWLHYDDNGPDFIRARRLDSTGLDDGDEIVVDGSVTDTSATFGAPKVAQGASGSFAIVWTGDSQASDGSGKSVRGRIYDAEMEPITDAFQVNGYTTGDQESPDITTLPDGSFMVTWQSVGSPGADQDGESILARRIWSPLVFTDGFEDGTLDAWSVPVP